MSASPGPAVRDALRAALDQATSLVDEADGEAAVHGIRKATKRLRAHLILVGPTVGNPGAKAIRRAIRDTSALLAPTRDADVLRKTLRKVAGDPIPEDLLPPRPVLDRAAALRRAAAELGAAADAADALDWDRFDAPALAEGLARSADRARRAMIGALGEPDGEAVHTWRKRTKPLWYQLRLARTLGVEVPDARIEALDRMQEALGDHHDLTVLASALLRDGWNERLAPLLPRIGELQGELLCAALREADPVFGD